MDNTRELGRNRNKRELMPLNASLVTNPEKKRRICLDCGEEFESFELGRHTRRYCEKCCQVWKAKEEADRQEQEKALAEVRYLQLVAQARIPTLWRSVTFAGSNARIRKAAFKIAQEYAEEYNVRSGTLVLYSKGYGCGKTHLAVCIANHALHQLRRPVLFKKARDLLLDIRHTFAEGAGGSEAYVLNQVLSIELLVLDDVGVDKPSPWIESTYWTIFDRRMEWQLPTVITTNYPLEAQTGEISLGDRIGFGAVSRLAQMCQGNFVDMSGPDLR